MTTIEESTVIRRSVDEVFAFVSDQHNAVRWQRGLVEVRRITDGPVGVGTKHAFVRKLMGRKIEAQNEYTAHEPNRRVAFRMVSGPMPLEASYLTERAAEGTRLTCRMEIARGGGVFGLLHRVIVRSIERQVRTDLATLRRLLDAEG